AAPHFLASLRLGVNALDSRLRGNDGELSRHGNDETAAFWLKDFFTTETFRPRCHHSRAGEILRHHRACDPLRHPRAGKTLRHSRESGNPGRISRYAAPHFLASLRLGMNTLDSRLRGNDGGLSRHGNDETAALPPRRFHLSANEQSGFNAMNNRDSKND
ncbi:MAG: hypothetical protein LBI87_00535, partial [Candidatus Accumulibacter sp.]|nr:hypothetical protein [Accumulibacter sp.]